MIGSLDLALICLTLKKFGASADQEVLMEVDNNNVMIVGEPHGILFKELRTLPFIKIDF
jgi:hypothetical protein